MGMEQELAHGKINNVCTQTKLTWSWHVEASFPASPPKESLKLVHIASTRLVCVKLSQCHSNVLYFPVTVFSPRDKVLDDIRRLIQPGDVIGRTVFDVDEPRWVT